MKKILEQYPLSGINDAEKEQSDRTQKPLTQSSIVPRNSTIALGNVSVGQCQIYFESHGHSAAVL